MTRTCETRPLGAAGLADSSFPAKEVRETAPKSAPNQVIFLRNPRAVREARLELLREAANEACSFIGIHAEVCQSLAEAGDDAGLLHSLGRLIAYAKEAARAGNDLRAIRDEAASNKEAGR